MRLAFGSQIKALNTLKGQRNLPVSVSSTYPPFVFPNVNAGGYQGIEVDLLDIMGHQLNFTYELELEPPPTLPNGTKTGIFLVQLYSIH